MAGQELDLEAIVREVYRRLEQLSDGGAADMNDEAETKKQASAKPAAQQTATDAAQLELADRTITMGLIAGRLDGVKEMLVPAGAVVTPSVRDELRRRQVVLRTAGKQAADAAPRAALVLGVTGGVDRAGAAVAAVQAEGSAAERIDHDCVLEVVRQVTHAIVAQPRIGLVLTDRPAVALCLANRHTAIRAAWGVNAASVRDATSLIGANLLVVDPALHGVRELRAMIREFRSGRHDCPEDYRRAVGGEP
jgi:hypothetical protein